MTQEECKEIYERLNEPITIDGGTAFDVLVRFDALLHVLNEDSATRKHIGRILNLMNHIDEKLYDKFFDLERLYAENHPEKKDRLFEKTEEGFRLPKKKREYPFWEDDWWDFGWEVYRLFDERCKNGMI